MVRTTRSDSLRQQIYELWVENPYITAKKICEKLSLNYKKYNNMINVRLSEFRSYYKFGLPQKTQVSRHRCVFVWECVPRGGFEPGGEMSLNVWKVGWRIAANRNGMWVFRDVRGSVHWYKEGLVRLYLKGPVQLARVKELFCKAFSWFSGAELSKYLDVPLREELKHWVFDVGAPMPRFDIRQFERSHGLRIFTDGSHPTALEVEETRPFWLGAFEAATEKFGEEIQAHLKLIDMWRKEAKFYREKAQKAEIAKKERDKTDKKPAKFWKDLGVV